MKTPATITLDRERTMRLDLNVLATMEEKTGISWEELDVGHLNMSQLRTFLWACLKGDDPELTEEQVGALIDLDNFSEVVSGLHTLVTGVTPIVPNRPARRARAAKAG